MDRANVRCAVLALGLMACGAQAAQLRKFNVYGSDGKQSGEQVTTVGDDGWVHVKYGYKDNGRGPDYVEDFRLAPDGSFAEYRIKGNSTFGAEVDEHFAVEGGKAKWASKAEHGEVPMVAGSMYLPLNDTFEAESAMISQALAHGGKVGLLPGGEVSYRKLDEVEVGNGSGSGKQRVQLLARTGIGFSPDFFWATTSTKPRFFAYVQPGFFAVVEEGWDGNIKALTARQMAADAALLRDVAHRLQKPLPGLTVVRNARVFDSATATVGAPSDVYVFRGRITQVLPAGSTGQGVDHAIDAAGRIMLPGLFDLHAHMDRWSGALDIGAGVTSVRDMGNDKDQMQLMIGETADGTLLGPQITPAGFIEGESKFAARMGFVVSNLDEAKVAVDWYAQHGYPQLKIYNSFHKDILKDTIAYAHSRGMRVSGHIPAFLRAQDAIDAGYDEIQHINQVLLNFLVTPETDTRDLSRFILPAEKVAGLDFDSKPVQDFIALLARKQISIDPTLSAFDFIRHRDGTMSQVYGGVADHFPPDRQRELMAAEMKIPDDKAATYEKSFEKMVEFVGRMYRAGVPIVAGTDELPGFTLQRELQFYVQAGMTPAQAIQVATQNGAKYSRTDKDKGRIAPGMLADLVLVDGDPTRDITDIRKVALVITRGYAISPSAVWKELGVKPFVNSEPEVK